MTTHFQSELNPEQIEAVEHLEGPLLVLAGAGSGKTRIVAYRIASLIAAGVSPDEIMAVTFTNKAAGEMKSRVEKLLNHSRAPLIATFHSLGAKILRESIEALGISSKFTIYDEDNSLAVIRQSLASLGLKGAEADAKEMRGLISAAKNQCLSASEIKERAHLQPSAHFAPLYEIYEKRLRESQALDFDDLLYLTVRLLREKEEILSLYQGRCRFLLIDEYQDTNLAQYWIAKLLVAKSGNLFVVGDPDQAIYSWRGANIGNILNFEKDYPGAKVIRLEQNYRSTPTILGAANLLISNNKSRYPKKLWSNRSTGEKIGLFVGSSERDEADFAAEEIDYLHRKENVPFREMAILYRTNFQSRSFEDSLLRRRIPYTIVGGLSFYHRKEIKDILAFLQMIVSDFDVQALARTINLPKRGFGAASLEKLRHGASENSLSIFQFLQKLLAEGAVREKQRDALQDYVDTILSLRELAKTASLRVLIAQTITQTRYLDILKEDLETFEERKANLDELVGKAAEYDLMHENPSLTLLLEELSLKSAVDEMGEDIDRLTLMTLHHGKGLEFGTVFLTGMEEDLFPHANAKQSPESVEEERRLCYVGMTRAKERLYLTAAESRFLWGGFRTMRPSRFLREIPRELIERIG